MFSTLTGEQLPNYMIMSYKIQNSLKDEMLRKTVQNRLFSLYFLVFDRKEFWNSLHYVMKEIINFHVFQLFLP